MAFLALSRDRVRLSESCSTFLLLRYDLYPCKRKDPRGVRRRMAPALLVDIPLHRGLGGVRPLHRRGRRERCLDDGADPRRRRPQEVRDDEVRPEVLGRVREHEGGLAEGDPALGEAGLGEEGGREGEEEVTVC